MGEWCARVRTAAALVRRVLSSSRTEASSRQREETESGEKGDSPRATRSVRSGARGPRTRPHSSCIFWRCIPSCRALRQVALAALQALCIYAARCMWPCISVECRRTGSSSSGTARSEKSPGIALLSLFCLSPPSFHSFAINCLPSCRWIWTRTNQHAATQLGLGEPPKPYPLFRDSIYSGGETN